MQIAGVLRLECALTICGFASAFGRLPFPTSEFLGRACGPLLTGLLTPYRERTPTCVPQAP
jgi:hypothetical protein